MKNVNLGWYGFAAFVGFASGACFSKAMYHKGKADAYKEAEELLRASIESAEVAEESE